MIVFGINDCHAECFVKIVHPLNLELLMQFPATNDEKYIYF